MRHFIKSVCLIVTLSLALDANAQAKKVVKSKPSGSQIQFAITQLKSGQYLSAANNLLALSRRTDVEAQKPQIKYMLGLAFMEMDMNQVAAFQFVDVIKSGDAKFVKPALEKLLITTDKLGDETLLNYALQRIDVNNLPEQNKDILYYHLGDIKQKAGQFAEAHQMYSLVSPSSRFYYNALYNLGLSQAEAGQTDLAIQTFNKLLKSRSSADVTDTNKVSAQMALARIYYQKKDWNKSIEMYSQIPRDHFMWHDALFEQSWAMLRAARFRSALSNFQSLHSSYYDDFYIPETLTLRAIVYLYICKYDEMEKVLNLFDKQYGSLQTKVQSFLKTKSSVAYYNEVEKAYLDRFRETKSVTRIPYIAAKNIAAEGDVRRSLAYIQKVTQEKKLIEKDSRVRSLPVGAYALKLLNNRIFGAKERTGDMVKAHMQNMNTELSDLKDQASLIKYEMINGQKEALKKKLDEKDLNASKSDAEEKDRSFYAQNGYEYYPFQGEFWLDEIGNYHYLGKQSCE